MTNKNECPKDYMVCQSSDKTDTGGCGNQEYILADSINGGQPTPIKKRSSATTAFILCLLGIISIFAIIMWVIYKVSGS